MGKNYDKKRVYYSQNREDIILLSFFSDQKKGFYVDVGANDPVKHSVTKLFYDRGWSGLNIEPNEMLLSRLKRRRPRDINMGFAVSDRVGKIKIRLYNSPDGYYGLSTVSSSVQENYEHEHSVNTDNYRDVEVDVITLKKLFDRLKLKTIDFMKVDVEGYEFEVLMGNDWTKYRPRVICIEANHLQKDWREYLISQSYIEVFDDGLNKYYVDERTEIAKKFSYVDTAILAMDGGIKYEDYIKIIDLQTENIKLQKENDSLRNTNTEIQQSNDDLVVRLEEVSNLSLSGRSFKSRVKRSAIGLTTDYIKHRKHI